MRQFFLAPLLAALTACATHATSPETNQHSVDPQAIQVLLVGAFHMGNPGRDVANAEIENMLTPQRQAEIANVVEAILEFQPTVVAVERITDAPAYIDERYNDYTPADLTETPNERLQLGYRLANLAGLDRVYGIDEQPSDGEPDYFPFDKLMAHAEETGQSDKIGAQIAEIQEIVAEFSASQKEKNVAELLIAQNDDVALRESSRFYYETFQYDRGEAQPGAELQAYWFMRNAKIFSKLAQVTKPGDRVVIIYGAGHKFWLEHFSENTPGFERVDPMPYLEKAAAK